MPSDKAYGDVDIRGFYRPVQFHGEPFYGIGRTTAAIEAYGLNLDPDYQRGHVWTQKQSSLFVGYLLEGGRTSPVIINTGLKGLCENCEVVDGKQRIIACLMWEKNEIPGITSSGVEVWKKDLDLPSVRQTSTLIGMAYGCVKLSRRDTLELYIKLNSGGTVHTQDEIERVKGLIPS